MNKLIYHFGPQNNEGDASMKDKLGGKGANLAEMSNLGLPIPPGFTIATNMCSYYYTHGNKLTADFEAELLQAIHRLEKETGKVFGSKENPLLVSVRSGAKISMPGMMDTILNLGMNDEVAEILAETTSNPRFAYDSYRRFIQMYGSVVLEIPAYIFEDTYDNHKINHNINNDSEVTTEILKAVIQDYKKNIHRLTGKEFENNLTQQLIKAIEAVLKSWMSPRAVHYRKINNISEQEVLGTAVNIQSMVFGNKGNHSATGVVFTRSPADGERKIFGEFLINAQGEDVVAGIRTPQPILAKEEKDGTSMQELMSKAYEELISICAKLESHYGDMQDIEFTIEEGKLYILQTRKGKRAAAAAVKIAVDMVNEGILTKETALLRIEPESLNQLLHTGIDYSTKPEIIAQGLAASPGAATGIAVFSPYDAEELAHHHKVILVRNDTSPEDIKGMHVAKGIITARGGMTSHAAVVARGMGRPCVCGVKGLTVNEKEKYFITSSGKKIHQGEVITLDGSTGKIIVGTVNLIEPQFSPEFETILKWADSIKNLHVRANAETAVDARMAIKFGAVGVGLCRTEHMFFDAEKIPLVREMIIAQDYEHRMKAIAKLKPLQTADFKELFSILGNMPLNIRLLDPPLHEFLPTLDQDKENLARTLEVPKSVIDHRLHVLHEINPMLGHRGCRLGITYPEIYSMQVEAILEAMWQLYSEEGLNCNLELMIPLISDFKELEIIKNIINKTVNEIEKKYSHKFRIKTGTMIELPRAALTADKISPLVDYFSFGTNDLTQTTLGISRDDTGSFLGDYIEQKIFNHDPFITIDEEGVGFLVQTAIEKGKKTNNTLSFGVCGEHAGDPKSIDFFHKVGMDYISCSPFRVPIARVAAARSKIINQ
ncbi:Pyruvate, phosphate dikinase [Candidatus Megaera polyxenophila]|nr:Pyruvate, phosphate dikinase [Candidatus Megaera polyxenophila]